MARIYNLRKDLRRVDGKTIELKGANMPITGVDICRDNSRVVATSKDTNAYVFDVKSQ